MKSMKCCNQIFSSATNVVIKDSKNCTDAKKSLPHDRIITNSSSDNSENFEDGTITAPCELHIDENCSFSQSDQSIGLNAQFDESENRNYLDDTAKLKIFLTDWALKNHITHTALSTLL